MAVEDMRLKRWEGHGDDWPPGHRPCVVCGEMLPFSAFHKHSQCKHGVNTVCKLCRKPTSKERYSNQTAEYKLWYGAKTRAREAGKDFDIEIDDIVIQDKCPVLDIKYEHNTPAAPSLDRIDNSKGYIKGNVVVMSRRANALKGDATVEEIKKLVAFLERCEIV